MNDSLKISLFLLGEKGFSALKAITESHHSPTLFQVIYAEDKNVVNDYSQDIRELCKKKEIHCVKRNSDYIETEYNIAIGWRWIIQLSRTQLIVIHDSLLPKYRGFAPLVNMLINGENELGATALYAEKGYDQGPILYQKSQTIEYPITIQQAIEIVAQLYNQLVGKIIEDIVSNTLPEGTIQDETQATYSLWRDEEDYWINWKDSAERIQRKINAVGTPYKGARTYLNGESIIVNKVDVIPDLIIENRDVGKVIFVEEGLPIVVCGKSLLRITDAIFSADSSSILPIKKFRSRFGQ